MSKNSMIVGGLNRGGKTILNELQEDTVRHYDPSWIVADPKEDRAVQFARTLQDRFATLWPQPLQMRVQDALAYSRDHNTVVLALDTVSDTAETLEARLPLQRVTFQFAGRGPNGSTGTHLAIQGTLVPGDQNTERQAHLLLRTLGGMSQATSSRNLRGPDPLTAAVLQPMRLAASRQTVRHLAEKEREPGDLSGSPLSVIFGSTIFPLIPVQAFPQDTYPQWKACALDVAGELPAKHFIEHGLPGRVAVIAVVIPEARAVHFMRIAQTRSGKRSLAGVTTFTPPRVIQQSSSINAAVFTD